MKPFLLTCVALLAVTVFGVKLIVWIDKPAEAPLLVDAAMPAGNYDFNLPFVIGAELCPLPPQKQEERISHT